LKKNMEQTQNVSPKRNYLIAGLVVVVVIGYFLFQRKDASNPQTTDDQTNSENTSSAPTGSETSQNTNNSTNQNQTTTGNSVPAGNVSATGTLVVSDNPGRGNLMLLDSSHGKIYVKTSRDFTAIIGKPVTLSAKGTVGSFVFLGFNPSSGGVVAGTTTTDTSAMGGGDTQPAGTVNLSGTLAASDNQVKGNYIINSSSGKIYLKSQHDYSAWVGSDVALTATGTINSYTSAVLAKK
jgi:hypothetical protein